jgi:hypothetical protein
MKNLIIDIRYRWALIQWKLQIGDYSPHGRYGVEKNQRQSRLEALLDA